MDNVDKIIKNKLESFEVPFNEAHWNEMNTKLNKIKFAKAIKTFSLAAAIVAVIISAIVISNTTTKDKNESVSQTEIQPSTQSKELLPEKIELIKQKATTSEITSKEQEIINENIQDEKDAELVEETILIEDELENNPSETSINSENRNNDAPESAKIYFEVLNPIVCLEQMVYFKSYTEGSNLTYAWDFGDGTSSNEAHPKHNYKADGVYDVSLVVTDQKANKTFTSNQNSAVTILPIPKQDFSYTEQSLLNDRNKIKYPYTTFSVAVKNVKAYVWDAGNGKISTEASPEFLFEKEGTYPIKATFTHQSGCEVTFVKEIEIQQNFDLLAPTGIEPNNSNKERATFLPKALYTWDIKFEIVITDKYGSEVYTTTNNKEPWNGRLNNVGDILPEGVYVWKATTFDVNNVKHNHSGTVKLIAN